MRDSQNKKKRRKKRKIRDHRKKNVTSKDQTAMLCTSVHRYCRIRSVECPWPRFYNLCTRLYAIFGALELILLVGLSIVGEREFSGTQFLFG